MTYEPTITLGIIVQLVVTIVGCVLTAFVLYGKMVERFTRLETTVGNALPRVEQKLDALTERVARVEQTS